MRRGSSSGERNDVDGRRPGVRRDRDRIIRPDTESDQRQVQCRGTVPYGDRMSGAGSLANDGLELLDLRSLNKESRPEHSRDRFNVLITNRRGS